MKKLIAAIMLAFTLAPVAVYGVGTTDIGKGACNAVNNDAVGCGTKPILGNNSVFESAIYVVIGIIASISVLMVIIGGLRYVLSGGDSAGIKSAKDTIIYAVVGLVLSMLAGAIVRFVIGGIS